MNASASIRADHVAGLDDLRKYRGALREVDSRLPKIVRSGSVEIDRHDFRFELIAYNDLASTWVGALPLPWQRECVGTDD